MTKVTFSSWRGLSISIVQQDGPAQPYIHKCDPLHQQRATAIQQDIPWGPGPVGQKGLVPLIPTGHERCARKRQLGIEQKSEARQTQPPGAQPSQSQRAISEKMAGLANGLVNVSPADVADRPKERLKQNAQRMRRPVGAEVLRRLHCNDRDSHGHGPPGADPEPGSPRTRLRPWGGEPGSPRTGLRPWGGKPDAAPATRHGSWAPRE